MVKPVLVFTYGNPSRGDDALGPVLGDKLSTNTAIQQDQVEFLTDFQLQIEHALDLQQRRLVLFADASVACSAAFEWCQLKPKQDVSYSTHAISPAAVLQVYQSIKKETPPPCFLLSIKAEQFELGDDLSIGARENLRLAYNFAVRLLAQPSLPEWQQLTRHARTITA